MKNRLQAGFFCEIRVQKIAPKVSEPQDISLMMATKPDHPGESA